VKRPYSLCKPVTIFINKVLQVYFIYCFCFLSFFYTAQAQEAMENETPVLKGGIARQANITPETVSGEVVDAETGYPLSAATLKIPDLNYTRLTGENGAYSLPNLKTSHPYVLSIEKEGYEPFSLSISSEAPPPFTLRLSRLSRAVVLDVLMHHLGDGSFSPFSNAAEAFRKKSEGPLWTLSFSIHPSSLSANTVLQIGSIQGLDTHMAHMLSKSLVQNEASPLVIRLNQQILARVVVNGDKQRFIVPKGLLKEHNLLEIQTGSQTPEPGRVDYDDMEFLHVLLYP
jgi:hypothetical protein